MPAFAKGRSGNPGGRPKEHGDIRELARKHCPRAIAVLVEIMEHGEREQARIGAAEALLDRGYGKPAQEIQLAGDITINLRVVEKDKK